MGETSNSTIVVLTGPKHAGKTSTGQVLAQLFQGDFVDLDQLVEQQTGKSPRTLYKEGPEIFRQAEAAALETTMKKQSKAKAVRIIAAGGGIVDNEKALILLQIPEVIIVYLDVSAETAWTRICAGMGTNGALPPFLDTANPRETHTNLHRRRAAAYKQIAHIIIQGEHKSLEDISREIHKALQVR